MTKLRLNAICLSLLSVLAVACADVENPEFEDDPGLGQDGGNVIDEVDMAPQDDEVDRAPQDDEVDMAPQYDEVDMAPQDDEVDPYNLTIVFDDGEVSVTDAVSYPMGDTEDVVFYSVDFRFALGQLEIRAFCDGEGVDNIEFVHRGETFNCDPTGVLVVDRLVGPDIPGSGSVSIEAIDAVDDEGTFVTWILEGSVTPL